MTKQEFSRLAQGLKAAYPSSKILADQVSLDFWYRMIQDLPYAVAEQAILEHIATSTWPPSIAEIRQACERLTHEPIKDPIDAWGDVRRAIARYGRYRPEEAYAELDDITRDIVKAIGWTRLCDSEDLTTDRANFRNAYEIKANRARQERALPQGLQQNRYKLLVAEVVSKCV